MEIKFSAYFSEEINHIISFIEGTNTFDAGERWFLKFEQFLYKNLSLPEVHPICNNFVFKKYYLRCLFYNDWTIAFKIETDYVLLVSIIHKSNIID